MRNWYAGYGGSESKPALVKCKLMKEFSFLFEGHREQSIMFCSILCFVHSCKFKQSWICLTFQPLHSFILIHCFQLKIRDPNWKSAFQGRPLTTQAYWAISRVSKMGFIPAFSKLFLSFQISLYPSSVSTVSQCTLPVPESHGRQFAPKSLESENPDSS